MSEAAASVRTCHAASGTHYRSTITRRTHTTRMNATSRSVAMSRGRCFGNLTGPTVPPQTAIRELAGSGIRPGPRRITVETCVTALARGGSSHPFAANLRGTLAPAATSGGSQ